MSVHSNRLMIVIISAGLCLGSEDIECDWTFSESLKETMKRKFRFAGGRYTVCLHWREVTAPSRNSWDQKLRGLIPCFKQRLVCWSECRRHVAGTISHWILHTHRTETGQCNYPHPFCLKQGNGPLFDGQSASLMKAGSSARCPWCFEARLARDSCSAGAQRKKDSHLEPLGFYSHMELCVQGTVFLPPQGRQECFQLRAFLEL